MDAILNTVAKHLGSDYLRAQVKPIGGGCINQAFEIGGSGLATWFMKCGPPSHLDMFQKEMKGLELMARCDAVHVPKGCFAEVIGDRSVLVMEFIPMRAVDSRSALRFGEALAALHLVKAQAYGLDHDNYIGSTPQFNQPAWNWWTFFCEQRLQPQLKRALSSGFGKTPGSRVQRLIDAVPALLGAHSPPASLLHGDLWSGNHGVDEQGKPVLFDPAVYFGDGETDLAMSRLFGTLPEPAYEAYHGLIPQQPEAGVRSKVYDLYHWLNHFNLFGNGYRQQVTSVTDALLYELG